MLYDYPEYYETAFSFRDIAGETDFIEECIKKYSDIKVSDIFEIACGHAPHVEKLSERGYRYIGLDINKNMLDYATYKWKNLNPQPEFIEGNMVSFSLNKKIDFAFIMLGSLYLNSADEMTSHFDSISNVLNKGGLYFLDWCIQFGDPMELKDDNGYTIEKDGIIVESKFDIKVLDKKNQMYEEIWTIDVNDRGRHKTFKMVERNKSILPQEFINFIKNRKDFEFIGWWQDWDLNHPITDENNVTRPVALIKKI